MLDTRQECLLNAHSRVLMAAPRPRPAIGGVEKHLEKASEDFFREGIEVAVLTCSHIVGVIVQETKNSKYCMDKEYGGIIIRRKPTFAAIRILLIISVLFSLIVVPEQTVEPCTSDMHMMNERDSVLHHLSQTLLSPENDSIHKSGTVVEVEISGDNFVICTYYNWDGAANDTMNWVGIIQTLLPVGDGLHILYCYTKGAYDGQPIEWINRRFVFTTDDTKPAISLNSPINSSTHQSGTMVSLNITDINGIGEVYYSWNGAANTTLPFPYDLSMPAEEEQHILKVNASDVAGNWIDATFAFNTDDTKPTISLNSPINGSTHQSGTMVSLNITDINDIGEVYYSWNGGGNVSLVAPFNISLPSDIGTYVLHVYATDVAGNSASETYVFTVTELSGAFILTDLLVYGIILATLVSLVVILRKRRV